VEEQTIGIKVADGTFYPILTEASQARKQLVLTTVNDEQTIVQIDLYQGKGNELADARYIGSLLIEDIVRGKKGEADIELTVALDESMTVSAAARDVGSGQRQSISVSLNAVMEEDLYDIPEFEFDDTDGQWEEGESAADEEYEQEPFGEDEYDGMSASIPQELLEPERRKPLMLILFIVLGVSAVVILAYLLFQLFQGPTIPPLQTDSGLDIARACLIGALWTRRAEHR
jgi:hypothetical protein